MNSKLNVFINNKIKPQKSSKNELSKSINDFNFHDEFYSETSLNLKSSGKFIF